jgi:hypothetical protein
MNRAGQYLIWKPRQVWTCSVQHFGNNPSRYLRCLSQTYSFLNAGVAAPAVIANDLGFVVRLRIVSALQLRLASVVTFTG